MEKRRLGSSGPELTTVGFGAWALGGGDWAFSWGPQDDQDSIAAIHEALDLGVNWIDTAAVYGLGHSEEVVGKAIQGRRDEVFVATKCALVWDEAGKVSKDLSAESIRKEIEDSLRRLQVEVIDLYQIHWPAAEDKENDEGWAEVARAVTAGKIRYAGLSNFSVEQMKRAQTIHPITSLQPPYSMLRRDIEAEILPYCKEQGIGVVPYSPLQSGLLTGKYNAETIAKLADDDWRKTKSDNFKEPRLSATLTLIEKLKAIAEGHGKSVTQLAIAWTLRNPEVSSAIVGARRPGQMKETSGASGYSIPPTDLEKIERLLADWKAAIPEKKD